jgi:hypothetical protein
MGLTTPSKFISIVHSISHSTFRIYIEEFYVQIYSQTISLIDKRQPRIFSLALPDTCDSNDNKHDFLIQCRNEYSKDQYTLSKITQFETNYCSEQAVYWYTQDTFVYRIVNKALRSGNTRLINRCRFYIRDLHQQMSYLHQTKYQRDIVQSSQIYYRGMTLSKVDLNKLVIGKLITFNSFISASLSRDVAMMFAGNVLLQIEVQNRIGLYAIFHSISDLSHFKHEEEILFSIGNVFRVEDIEKCENNVRWNVKLILQKHIQYRSNFRRQSTNGIKYQSIISFIKRVRKIFVKLLNLYSCSCTLFFRLIIS